MNRLSLIRRKRCTGPAWPRYICAAVTLAILLLCVGCSSGGQEVVAISSSASKPSAIFEGGALDEILKASGQGRTISHEEYEFFYQLVDRDSTNRGNEDAVKQETMEFINRQNAEFYLAELAGLRKPYSFETIKADMEQENKKRVEMKANGEVFYGLGEFNLTTYYKYITSNLSLDNMDYIAKQTADELEAEAKVFFEENIGYYESIEEITYEVEREGKTETLRISYLELRTLQKTDETLFNFLLAAEPGDEMHNEDQNGIYKVIFDSMIVRTPKFEQMKDRATKDLISTQYYDQILAAVAQNNPVVLKA